MDSAHDIHWYDSFPVQHENCRDQQLGNRTPKDAECMLLVDTAVCGGLLSDHPNDPIYSPLCTLSVVSSALDHPFLFYNDLFGGNGLHSVNAVGLLRYKLFYSEFT